MSTFEYDPVTGQMKSKKKTTSFGGFDSFAPETPQDFHSIPTGPGAPGYGTSTTMPGLTGVDYTALINEQMKPLRDMLNQQQGFDRAGLTAARQRAIAQFGFAPDLAGMDQSFLAQLNAAGAAPDIAGDVTAEVRALADKNTAEGLSTRARLDAANKKALAQIKNTLASRGLLRSGEAGYQLGEQQQAFKQANADAVSKLNEYLAGVAQAYADSERGRQQQLLSEQQAAASRVAQQTAGTPAFQGEYAGQGVDGSRVFRGPDGRLYAVDASGNRVPYTGPVIPDQAPPPPPPALSSPFSGIGSAVQATGSNIAQAFNIPTKASVGQKSGSAARNVGKSVGGAFKAFR